MSSTHARLDFADAIREITGGAGVDIVLNSLAGEFIAASFRSLARGGCFLELGKRDIWSQEQAARVRPDVSYVVYDLGVAATRRPDAGARDDARSDRRTR